MNETAIPGIHTRLIPLAAGTSGLDITVGHLPVVLGRQCPGAVHVYDRWVSRRHCTIGQVNGTLWVRDLGSRHGTFVNGAKIREALVLPGDRLSIGSSKFRVEYFRTATEDHPRPPPGDECDCPSWPDDEEPSGQERLRRRTIERAERLRYEEMETLRWRHSAPEAASGPPPSETETTPPRLPQNPPLARLSPIDGSEPTHRANGTPEANP